MKLEEPRGSHKDGGRAQGGRARTPPLCAPHAPPDLILSPIYSHISPNHQRRPQKHFSTAATFCTHEIPSRDLFRHTVRGGFNHGGLLHQINCPSDEAWVVYHMSDFGFRQTLKIQTLGCARRL